MSMLYIIIYCTIYTHVYQGWNCPVLGMANSISDKIRDKWMRDLKMYDIMQDTTNETNCEKTSQWYIPFLIYYIYFVINQCVTLCSANSEIN
jgi:hypothetical protein